MSLKTLAARLFARRIAYQTAKWANRPLQTQQKVLQQLVATAAATAFGKDHDFAHINTHQDFVERVPLRDYEHIKGYVERSIQGETDVLWPGKPLYFAKTSGTTSGAKYIPLTQAAIQQQVKAARNAILNYIHETGNASFVDGKMLFLQGSPVLEEKGGIQFGRLSGIAAHYVPNYLQKNRLPAWETNCIEDWETKVNRIVSETLQERMTLIAGIPSWVQMYFERLQAQSGKKVGEVFPDFQLFLYGGVNYAPYRAKFESLIGRKVDSVELFPASEGFFAYQNAQQEAGMLLLLNSGIFYEFVKADAFFTEAPKRLTLAEVEVGVDYVMIVSTNAGLWGYNLGDTVRFTSTAPYKVIVSGRLQHFISAFGEHVIAKEVEQGLQTAVAQTNTLVNEFTVAPQTDPEEGALPYHEWFVEFERLPSDMAAFARIVEDSMQAQNSYYYDLVAGGVLQPLRITPIKAGGFRAYMKRIGKLGGQNKVQRLANDRKLAEGLQTFKA